MQILKSTVFRALCAIAIGYMLIEYPEMTQIGLVRAVGALFLVSGIISWANFLYQKKHVEEAPRLFDADGNEVKQATPFFPIAGSGSMILGLVLLIMPETLIGILHIIFGVMIMLGAFNQFFALMNTRKYAQVPIIYWIFSSIIILAGLFIVLRLDFIDKILMQLCGFAFIAYAMIEVLIAVQTAVFKKRYFAAQDAFSQKKAEEENLSLLGDKENDN